MEHHNWLSLSFVFFFFFSLIWMNCLWFLTVIPYSSNFLRIMEWSTVSKAFDRSMNTPSVYSLFSKDSIIWSTNCTTAWSVEWPFCKPNCLEYKIWFLNQVSVQTIIHYALEYFAEPWEHRYWSIVTYVTTVFTLLNRSDPCYL